MPIFSTENHIRKMQIFCPWMITEPSFLLDIDWIRNATYINWQKHLKDQIKHMDGIYAFLQCAFYKGILHTCHWATYESLVTLLMLGGKSLDPWQRVPWPVKATSLITALLSQQWSPRAELGVDQVVVIAQLCKWYASCMLTRQGLIAGDPIFCLN